jgi:hypothetical protein
MWTHVTIVHALIAAVGAAVHLLRRRCRGIMERVGREIRLRRASPSTKASCQGDAWSPPLKHCRAGFKQRARKILVRPRRIKVCRGRLNWGSCLTDTTHRGRARLTVRVFAAMLRSERLHNNHRGLLTRWNHTDLRARKVGRKLWTNEAACQASARPMVICYDAVTALTWRFCQNARSSRTTVVRRG